MALTRSVAAVFLVGLSITASLPLGDENSEPDSLPRLNINTSSITVSGISSGAFFAVQFHVAFSTSIQGAGIFAGGPYWCAKDDVARALSACMGHPELIDVAALIAATDYAATIKSIDPPKEGLQHDRVWMFTGEKDTEVKPGVVDKTHEFYDHWVEKEDSHLIGTYPASHAWVTDKFGNDCDFFGTPYINNCHVDAAGEMLQFLFENRLVNRTTAQASSIVSFSQKLYTPIKITPADISLGPTGMAYIPAKCTSGSECKLHIAFHGCEQDLGTIGDALVQHSGLNEWAEANDMVVLYPQAAISNVTPYNPKGCWDWWGYTLPDYATQIAPQIDTIKNMIHAVTGNFKSHWEK